MKSLHFLNFYTLQEIDGFILEDIDLNKSGENYKVRLKFKIPKNTDQDFRTSFNKIVNPDKIIKYKDRNFSIISQNYYFNQGEFLFVSFDLIIFEL